MKASLNALLVASVLSAAPAFAQLEYYGPYGGWNYSGVVDKPEELNYAYPSPPIDRGAQKNRMLIRGRLKAAANDRVPPKLVVNGNPMLLYGDGEGRFARPYAFGPGSNSIEIRSGSDESAPRGARGKPLKRVQFYEANPNKAAAHIRIIMTWDDPQAEVDMHVVTPDGGHAFWAAPLLENGGGLDVDSVDGAGPEIFSVIAPPRGSYYVYVNYWGNFGAGGYHFDEATRKRDVITTRVTVIYYENTPREKRESFVVPLRKIGDLTLINAFTY
jgi:uncharacterized protein YfaP (DUF2135 family)